MFEDRNPKTVFIMGTSREDTLVLLNRMSTAAIGNVILYDAPEATLGQAQAEEFVNELQITHKNTEFSLSTDLSDIERAEIIIIWGYNFIPASGENLVAARKLFKNVVEETIDMDGSKNKLFLFPDNLNGLIYANLFLSLITEAGIQEKDTPDIKVISSIATSGVAAFGSSDQSATAWPSLDGFFVDSGINDENYGKLEFYRDCHQENKRPHFIEAVSMADFVKLFCTCRTEKDLQHQVQNRMKLIGRIPDENDVENIEIEKSTILFLPVPSDKAVDLSVAVKRIIKSTEAEVKNAIKFLKN